MARSLPLNVIATIQSASAPFMRGCMSISGKCLSSGAKIKGWFIFSALGNTCFYRSSKSVLHFKIIYGRYLSMWELTEPPGAHPLVLQLLKVYTLPVLSSPRATLR